MNIGDIVKLKTDHENRARIVTGIIIRPNTQLYYLSCGKEESVHYEIETLPYKDKSDKVGFKK